MGHFQLQTVSHYQRVPMFLSSSPIISLWTSSFHPDLVKSSCSLCWLILPCLLSKSPLCCLDASIKTGQTFFMVPAEQEGCFSRHVGNYPNVDCFHLDCCAIKSPFYYCNMWLTQSLKSKMEPENGSRLHIIPTCIPSLILLIQSFQLYNHI